MSPVRPLTPSAVLCAGRAILGFGNSLAQLASPMLLTEIIHPQHRAPVTAAYNCLWNLGSLSKEDTTPSFLLTVTDLAPPPNSLYLYWLGHLVRRRRVVLAIRHSHPGCAFGVPACLHLV
jgi:MFS family permease